MSTSVFASLTEALLEPDTAFDWKLFRRLWHLLVESARPVSLDALAQALHTPRERCRQCSSAIQMPSTTSSATS